MKRQKLPNTDSIQELAGFWDTRDLTNFELALEEVGEPVFVRSKGASLSVDLPRREIQRVRQISEKDHGHLGSSPGGTSGRRA
jgi:hypothetical protein